MKATDRVMAPLIRYAAVLACVVSAGQAVCLAQPAAPVPVEQPGRSLVADVIVQGNRVTPTQQIQANLKTRAGAEYSPEAVQEDVRGLCATRQYADVKVDTRTQADGRVIVYFIVTEYPTKVEKVTYFGAQHLKDDALEQITGVRPGLPCNPIANRMACQAIVKKYNEEGRPFASCELIKGAQAGDTEVIFNINEGPKVCVRHINFVGNTFVSGGVLKTHIKTSGPLFGVFRITGTYVPGMVDADTSALEDYYRSHGFLDVRASRELQYTDDGRDVDVTYHIIEGPRYQIVAAPRIEGLRYLQPEQLAQLCKVKGNEVYDETKIKGDLERIKDYIGYTGRECRATPDLVFDKANPGLVTVNYQVEERPPARVGPVYIIGNTRTKQNVILRDLPLYPGQPLTYPDVRQAERNLARLGIFETSPDGSVKPTVRILDDEVDSEYKRVEVEVKETNTGSLMFGVGVNSDAGLTGSIVLNERNFDITRPPTSLDDFLSGDAWRGAGQEFRIEAVPGTQLQRYSVTFSEPRLFDSPYRITTQAYYNERQFNEDMEERLGGRFTVGRKLNQFWSASTSVRVENVGIHDVAADAPIDYQSVVGNNFLAGFKGSVVRDTTNSYLRPTEGSKLEVSFEEVTGAYSFPVFNVDYSKYFTTFQRADGSGKQVLVMHSAMGIAGDNTPVYERFYAGGFRSLRGFAFRGVGPETNGYELGGDFMLLNSLEYQVPLKANDQIYFVGFIDSGTVESKAFEINDYRVSAGVGLRFTVPMLGPVPIALDLGFPIVKAQGDQQQVFSFWLGFTR